MNRPATPLSRRPTPPVKANTVGRKRRRKSPRGTSASATGVVRVVVDPGQACGIEVAAGACDSDISQAGFGPVDGSWNRASRLVQNVGFGRWGEIGCDPYMGPFPAFGFVDGGHRDLGCGFWGELLDGLEDGVGSVLVHEVGEGLQTAGSGVVFGVFAQSGPAGEQQ